MKSILIRIENFLCRWTITHSFGGITALNIQTWMHKKWSFTKWDGESRCPDCNHGLRHHPGDILVAECWLCDDCGYIGLNGRR